MKHNTSLFSAVSQEAQSVLNHFDEIIRQTRPINSKQFQQLPRDIKQLFHYLTDERNTRRSGYMNDSATLTAYIYYYHWWNLVRLTTLFSGMPPNSILPFSSSPEEELVCVDIGSGPLTVPTALWLARPELRSRRLTWYCIDNSANALAAGTDLFYACTARTHLTDLEEPWQITKVKGSIGTALRKKAVFISCANLFNEVIQNSDEQLETIARRYAVLLDSYTVKGERENTRPVQMLIVEPGIPYAARFISLLRASLLKRHYIPVMPCPHRVICPLDGRRGGKWCHFVINAKENAPQSLAQLSKKAGLEKDRAVLSFLLAQYTPASAAEKSSYTEKNSTYVTIRVASDPIRLPHNRTGFYCCSEAGMILLTTDTAAATHIHSGDLLSVPYPREDRHDEKSGALIVPFFADTHSKIAGHSPRHTKRVFHEHTNK